MKKTQRLRVVIELYRRQEKQALEKLGVCQQHYNSAVAKLESLKQYRRDYEQRDLSQGGQNFSSQQFAEYRIFLAKLDQAINDQKNIIQQKKQAVMQQQQQWQRQHQKTESLKKLDEKALAEALRQAEKIEQSEQDNRSARCGNKSSILL